MTTEDHSPEDPEALSDELAATSEARSADDLQRQAVEEAEAVVLEAEAISRRMVEEARLEAELMVVAARDDKDPGNAETSPGAGHGDRTSGRAVSRRRGGQKADRGTEAAASDAELQIETGNEADQLLGVLDFLSYFE